MSHPLSIKYKPGFSIRYGWCGECVSVEEPLIQNEGNGKAVSRIREILLSLYMNDESYRQALEACESIEAETALFELDGVGEKAAQIYIDELRNLRTDALACRDASPKEMLKMVAEAGERDDKLSPIEQSIEGSPEVNRMALLGRFNKDYRGLVRLFMNLYRDGSVSPFAPSGRPNFMAPVTFLGWGGPDNLGQTFGFLPEIMEYGNVEIECPDWKEYRPPHIISEWSTGVMVVETHARSIVLRRKLFLNKTEVVISGKAVPVSECGKYVASIKEAGEFEINIYFRPFNSDDRICVFTYGFCCK